jgi:hypothetical protein
LQKKICDFFYRVFEFLLLQNAQKRDKNKSSKTTEGGGKKTEGEKKNIFVMSPFVLFFSPVFLNSSCYETPKKRDKTKPTKK